MAYYTKRPLNQSIQEAERPIEEVAAEFGVPNNTVSQTKTRVARMIAAHEALLGE